MSLRQAIHEAAVEKDLVQENEILMSYVVISCWSALDDEEGRCSYIHQIEEGMKIHEAIGLLHLGIESVSDDPIEE